MKRKPTVVDLMAEIEALKREIEALKARPAVVERHYSVERHYERSPGVFQPVQPFQPYYPQIWCVNPDAVRIQC